MQRRKVTAYHVTREIRLKELARLELRQTPPAKWEESLRFKLDDKDVLIYSFGSFAIVDPDDKTFAKVLALITRYADDILPTISETWEITRAANQSELSRLLAEEPTRQIEPRRIYVSDSRCILYRQSLTPDLLRVITFTLAQSAALERIENDVERELDRTDDLLTRFEKRGLILRTRLLQRILTDLLRTRHAMISDVMALEKPELTWEEAVLDSLATEVRRVFEISRRFGIIEKELEHMLETCGVISDLISTARTQMLEILFVVLIVLELVLWFVFP